MHDPSLESVQLSDVLVFHRQLLAMENAGLPIGLPNASSGETLAKVLDGISQLLAVEHALGKSIVHSMENANQIPKAYRDAFVLWFSSGHSPEAFGGLVSVSEWSQESRDQLGVSVFRPLVLACLGYVGFGFLALQLSPRIESLYQQARLPIGNWGAYLVFVRTTYLYWGIGFPLAVLLILVWWRRVASSNSMSWFSHLRERELQSLAKANCAEQMKQLVEGGMPVAEAVRLVGPDGASTKTKKSDLPVLVQWAIDRNSEGAEQVSALKFAECAYRSDVGRRSSRWRMWLPIVVGVVLGGGFVLTFGVSLFGPMVELLTAICGEGN